MGWHSNPRKQPWTCGLDMDADMALLQEAGAPPPEVAEHIQTDGTPSQTNGAAGVQP